MDLFKVEVKRVLKTRSTQIIIGIALVLAVLMARMPLSFVQYSYLDEQGEKVTLKGAQALAAQNKVMAPYEGEVTPDKVAQALEVYQAGEAKYGSIYSDEMPLNVRNEQMVPAEMLIKRLREVNADPKTGFAADTAELAEQDAANFYPQCRTHLKDLMRLEQKEHPDAQAKAVQMYEKVQQPFVFYNGLDSNAMDYVVLYIMLLVFLCTISAATTFSAEYQSQSDQILRCTRYGRRQLALAKIAAALTIFTVVFAMGLLVFSLILNSSFGWESRKTSMQILYSAVSLLDLNLGGLQNITIAAGLVTLLATLSCTLFISSRSASNLLAGGWAIGAYLLPIILYRILPAGGWADWLCNILPSSGVSLGGSFQYALQEFTFLHLGSWSVWSPWVILAAGIIEIPLFLLLAVRSYCRHSL